MHTHEAFCRALGLDPNVIIENTIQMSPAAEGMTNVRYTVNAFVDTAQLFTMLGQYAAQAAEEARRAEEERTAPKAPLVQSPYDNSALPDAEDPDYANPTLETTEPA